MIINFLSELNNAVNHSADLCREYGVRIAADKHMPSEHMTATLLFDEDLDKIRAICNAADELDKRNRELEKKVKDSGLNDKLDFYYPFGGGSL